MIQYITSSRSILVPLEVLEYRYMNMIHVVDTRRECVDTGVLLSSGVLLPLVDISAGDTFEPCLLDLEFLPAE
jgi:hypothetical protein